MNDLVNGYLSWLTAHHYSERTVIARRGYLKAFVEWCTDRDLWDVSLITENHLERYLSHQSRLKKHNGQAICARTCRNRLVPVKMFFRWLRQQKHIAINPAAELEMPRGEKRLPQVVLSADEMELVLKQAPTDTLEGIRDRAIMELFYSTGIRRAELCALQKSDLDAGRALLNVRQGKGSKDRIVPVGERALSWVHQYQKDVRPQWLDGVTKTLFLNPKGKPMSARRLSDRMRAYIDKAALGKTGSCHLFRHSCATLMLEAGADIRFIQQLLGHASLSTTQVYTQVSIRRLQEVHRETHPTGTDK